ncbi:GAF domain-containing protein [Jeotgalibacillus sp. ET6]|uniref:GAF domain-containing protein n=1 Tax=Jeotgalibacillus sp. ET6 TaxID=3037260 RepID=UPI002418BBF4|nr:STAS domain-containing protein [Jeotgalibacillus sp. ET6]MDG5473125.1 GAF domain-containing protein [Jeotgalibacillus sp. ET6]
MNSPSDYNRLALHRFKNFDEAAESILHTISELLDINTLFIAKNDSSTNEIVKVVNKNETLLNEGDSSPFKDTFCKLSVDHGKGVLLIPDITQNEQSKELNVTETFGRGSFVGVPIYYEDGRNYGTICGLDTNYFDLSERDKRLFQTMSSLLSYVLELDEATKQIEDLSAPLVPITKGVAILPIIGNIDLNRVERITELTLLKSQQLSLDTILIDLSGITRMNDEVVTYLMRIVDLLDLVGIIPILTGLRPETAMQAIRSHVDVNQFQIESTVESALNKIGFELHRK